MEKILKYIFIGVTIIFLVFLILYFGFIYLMGHNFVHDKPASQEYYNHVNGRIYFTTKFRGDKFNNLLDTFLKSNSQYVFSDTTNFFPYTDSCSCDCLPFTKIIYFKTSPKEAYQITYDHDTMYAGGAGVIDIVFVSKDNKWICTKTSKFDTTEQNRIKHRLDTAILGKLK